MVHIEEVINTISNWNLQPKEYVGYNIIFKMENLLNSAVKRCVRVAIALVFNLKYLLIWNFKTLWYLNSIPWKCFFSNNSYMKPTKWYFLDNIFFSQQNSHIRIINIDFINQNSFRLLQIMREYLVYWTNFFDGKIERKQQSTNKKQGKSKGKQSASDLN